MRENPCMEEEEGGLGQNSEIRYIALELMKLSQQTGRSFSEVAEEYLENTWKLQMMIAGEETKPAARRGEKSRQK